MQRISCAEWALPARQVVAENSIMMSPESMRLRNFKSGMRKSQAKSIKVFAEKYKPPYEIIMSGRPYRIDHKNRVHYYPLYLAGKIPLKWTW